MGARRALLQRVSVILSAKIVSNSNIRDSKIVKTTILDVFNGPKLAKIGKKLGKNLTFFRIFLFRGISLFLGGRFTTSRSGSFCSGVFLSLRIRILIRTAMFGTLFGLDFASSWTFASRFLIVFTVNEKFSIIHVILREITFTSFNFTENLSGGNLSEFPLVV